MLRVNFIIRASNAEQMNTALKEVPQSLGIDASKHQGPIDFQAQAGVHETNDLNNQGAINGGKRIFNDMASDFQSTADKKEGNIRQTEDWYQKVDKEQLAGMMSGFAFGADSSFIKNMAQHVPGGEMTRLTQIPSAGRTLLPLYLSDRKHGMSVYGHNLEMKLLKTG